MWWDCLCIRFIAICSSLQRSEKLRRLAVAGGQYGGIPEPFSIEDHQKAMLRFSLCLLRGMKQILIFQATIV